MKSQFSVVYSSVALICLVSCKTRSFRISDSNAKSAPSATSTPPQLPSAKSAQPWGGADPAKWSPESVFANALGAELNEAWQDKDLADALVAIPTKFQYGVLNPYGDGQINSRMESNPSWKLPRPQFVAVLKHYKIDVDSAIKLRLDRSLVKGQNQFEVLFKSSKSSKLQKFIVDAKLNAEGDLEATWKAPENWNQKNKSTDERYLEMASKSSALVRPVGQFDDWFPITFRHPVSTADKMIQTVDASHQKFSVDAKVTKPDRLDDPLDIKPKSSATNAFSNALDLEINKLYPSSFNPNHFPSCNVHGSFAYTWDDFNAGRVQPRAVGRNWTWLTNPNDPERKDPQGPFKILYTCFEPRRYARSASVDPECSKPEEVASEEDLGVPSGGGWHLIGDPAETLFNSVETTPLLVASGFAEVAPRIDLAPSDHGFAFGQKDVAVARWLFPGEAFMIAKSKELSQPNFHWFLFHGEEHTCTLEWVHECVPEDEKEPSFGGLGCKK
jgi:hypothetical protein